MTITISFPTDVPCADRYCPASAYEQEHAHTFYNVYEIPADVYVPGMSEITASVVADSVRPREIAPVNSMKGVFQNV